MRNGLYRYDANNANKTLTITCNGVAEFNATNTSTANAGNGMFIRNGALIVKGNGSLSATGANAGISINSSSTIQIEDCKVTAAGTSTNASWRGRSIEIPGAGNIQMNNSATLTLKNKRDSAETFSFKENPTSNTYQWKLTNAATTGFLTDETISVSIPGNTTNSVIEREWIPSGPPSISGPTAMTLAQGYASTSTGVYNITGGPKPTVTKTSGSGSIAWNNTTRKLDISQGHAAGN